MYRNSGQINIVNRLTPIATIAGWCTLHSTNGFRGVVAGIGICWRNVDNVNTDNNDVLIEVREPITGIQTNQRAELVAARRAIEISQQYGYNRLIIRTDSDYVFKSQTDWIHKWLGNNFNGGRVENRRDIMELWNSSAGTTVYYTKITQNLNDAEFICAYRLAKQASSF